MRLGEQEREEKLPQKSERWKGNKERYMRRRRRRKSLGAMEGRNRK